MKRKYVVAQRFVVVEIRREPLSEEIIGRRRSGPTKS
jgi:hypothetical protein